MLREIASTISTEVFLTDIIEEGCASVREMYCSDNQKSHLQGSLAGFEKCRGKQRDDLMELLVIAQRASVEQMSKPEDQISKYEYWYTRHEELQIAWVCNCLSAFFLLKGEPVIMQPTWRAWNNMERLLKKKVHTN